MDENLLSLLKDTVIRGSRWGCFTVKNEYRLPLFLEVMDWAERMFGIYYEQSLYEYDVDTANGKGLVLVSFDVTDCSLAHLGEIVNKFILLGFGSDWQPDIERTNDGDGDNWYNVNVWTNINDANIVKELRKMANENDRQ